jgi:hypothetical protein
MLALLNSVSVAALLGIPVSAVPGSVLTALPATGPQPTNRWSAQFSTMGFSSGAVLNSVSDLVGSAPWDDSISVGHGGVLMTDGLGRKFIRTDGTCAFGIPGLANTNANMCAMFFIGRIHKPHTGSAGSATLNNIMSVSSTVNTGDGAALFNCGQTINRAPRPYVAGRWSPAQSPTSAERANGVVGSNLQCLGFLSRTPTNGSPRWYANGFAMTSTGGFANTPSATTGGAIGVYAPAVGTTLTAGAGLQADIYEIVYYNANLTNAQADAIHAAYVANWGFQQITNQVVIPGDSITAGVLLVPSGDNIAMKLTDPGSPFAVSPTTRVINMARGGRNTPDMVVQRDLPFETVASIANTDTGLYNQLLSGTNIVAVEIGYNDMVSTGRNASAAVAYNNAVAGSEGTVQLINSTAVGSPITAGGYLQRGWSVRYAVGIQVSISDSGVQEAKVDSLRALIRDNTTHVITRDFLTKTLTDPGNTYDGKLKLIPIDTIKVSGVGIFDTSAHAPNSTYRQADNVHPTVAGTVLLNTGGDDPTAGYSYGVQH